jgi:hypothetical protein
MSLFGDFAKWLSKRIIIGVVITGVGLAAWNWWHSETTEKQPNPSLVSSGVAQATAAVPLPARRPAAAPTYGNDGWPSGIRLLSQEEQRKMLYLPPNISMEEAKRW